MSTFMYYVFMYMIRNFYYNSLHLEKYTLLRIKEGLELPDQICPENSMCHMCVFS